MALRITMNSYGQIFLVIFSTSIIDIAYFISLAIIGLVTEKNCIFINGGEGGILAQCLQLNEIKEL